ncbi:MAG: DUF1080 domain-containing protein [Granulicella sp.]
MPLFKKFMNALGFVKPRLLANVSLGLVAAMCFGTAVAQQPAATPAAGAPGQARQPGQNRAPGMPRFHEPDPINFDEHTGFTQLFDGTTLNKWVGDPETWRVEDGAIVGESTMEKPRSNTYLSYQGMEAHDFDLKLEIKAEKGGGTGIQYRSQVGLPWTHGTRAGMPAPNLAWMMTGPQADFWFPVKPSSFVYTGQFYSENTMLGILAWRGQVTESTPGSTSARLLGNIGDRSALGGYVKINDWNQYEIIARGGTFIHIINGQVMAVYIDDDPNSSNNKSGLIGIEIEGTPAKVSVRNIWLKKLN